MTARISLNLGRTGGHRPPLQSEHFLPLGKAGPQSEGRLSNGPPFFRWVVSPPHVDMMVQAWIREDVVTGTGGTRLRSGTPNTSRAIRAWILAPAHITRGSTVQELPHFDVFPQDPRAGFSPEHVAVFIHGTELRPASRSHARVTSLV